MNEQRNLSVSLRPANFDEFIGNNNIIKTIRTQLDSGRIPTAFLLSGPTGYGKTTLARCIGSRLEAELIETNAADDTGVDAARQLGETAQHRPLLGNYKLIILDEAHQLTKQAQNALLKHVEDAAPSTLWIFCTTEPGKIIQTLRGRCVSYTLAGLTSQETGLLVYRGLAHLGKKDAINVSEFINTLVREGITSPRAVLMALERFVGGMDPLAAIFSSADSPSAFQIAQDVAKRNWAGIRQSLLTAQTEEALTIRIVVVNYLKSMLLKGSDTAFAARAILELTQTIPAIDTFGLAELSGRLFNICNWR